MTTIAYAAGLLASDSRLTFNDAVCTDKCKKIWRLPDGGLFAACGDNEAGMILLKAMQKDTPLPSKLDRDVGAVHIRPNGRIYISDGLLWTCWPEKFVAIGSGGKYALAAMRAGASVTDAVKAGIAVDVYSGGRVQTLRLGKKRPRRA